MHQEKTNGNQEHRALPTLQCIPSQLDITPQHADQKRQARGKNCQPEREKAKHHRRTSEEIKTWTCALPFWMMTDDAYMGSCISLSFGQKMVNTRLWDVPNQGIPRIHDGPPRTD